VLIGEGGRDEAIRGLTGADKDPKRGMIQVFQVKDRMAESGSERVGRKVRQDEAKIVGDGVRSDVEAVGSMCREGREEENSIEKATTMVHEEKSPGRRKCITGEESLKSSYDSCRISVANRNVKVRRREAAMIRMRKDPKLLSVRCQGQFGAYMGGEEEHDWFTSMEK
jgi:hypothetical protein